MRVKPAVCVVGSINMDMMTSSTHMPAKGETILGGTFHTNPGGKGANQAIASSKLGADVSLIGAVGNDPFGEMLFHHFKKENINCEGIQTVQDESTGIATIIVTDQDNRIIVSSGANLKVSSELVEKNKHLIRQSDIILLQFEIPMETIITVVELANEFNIPIIVNPAPYQFIPKQIAAKVDYFTPNELENEAMKMESYYKDIENQLIITKGDTGATYFKGNQEITIPAYQTKVVDTTGAGDTFNGALATTLASKYPLDKAILFANAAAAISISKLGAQAGMPTKDEVNELLKKWLC